MIGSLWRWVWLGLHKWWRIWRLSVVDCRRKWNGHDAKCLGLKELHCGPNILFHEFCNLSFSSVIRPFFPYRLTSTTFPTFFLLGKESIIENDINVMFRCISNHLSLNILILLAFLFSYHKWDVIISKHFCTSTEDIGMSVTSGTTAPAPPSLLMLKTCQLTVNYHL